MPLLSPAFRAELAAAMGLTSIRRELRTELRVLTRAIKNLRAQVRKQGSALRTASRSRVDRAADGKRVLKLSPQRRAALKLQGQYMGALRALTAKQKASVKRVKASRGYAAAIRTAKALARR